MEPILDFILSLKVIDGVKVGVGKPYVTKNGTMAPPKLADHISKNFKKEIKESKNPDVIMVALDKEELTKFLSDNIQEIAKAVNPEQGHSELPSELVGVSIFQDVSDIEVAYVVSHLKKTVVLDYSPDVLCMRHGLDKETRMGLTEYGRVTYSPGREYLFEEYDPVSGETYKFLNLYTPPKWESLSKEIPEPRNVDLSPFLLVLRQVAAFPEERQYLISWLKKAIEDKAPTILILCGEPGIGKNTFFNTLSALFGYKNAFASKRSTLEKFNSHLENSKLLLFDELQWSYSDRERLKEFANDRISTESKGKNASRGTRIYASLIIMNNDASNNCVQYDDRKFVPLVTGTERLDIVAKKEGIGIDSFIDKINEESPNYCPHTVKAIYDYIINNGDYKKYPADMSYYGPGFWRLAYQNRTEWQRKVTHYLAHILLLSDRLRTDAKFKKDYGIFDTKKYNVLYSMYRTGEKLKWSHVMKVIDFDRIAPGHDKVLRFLKMFRTPEGEPIFKVESLPQENALSEIDFTIDLINPEKFILIDDAEAEL